MNAQGLDAQGKEDQVEKTDGGATSPLQHGVMCGANMKKLLMFKMPFKTNHFNENQRVWVRRGTGAMAAEVKGKFRGKGRYVTAWVTWDSTSKPNPEIKEIEVSEEFYTKMRGDCACDEWYIGLNT